MNLSGKTSDYLKLRLFTINNKNTKEDITAEFKNHFDKLLNTPRIANPDNSSTNSCNQTSSSELKDIQVTENDILNSIQSLHLQKSMDPFSIKAEHFLHLQQCKELTIYLKELYNHIIASGYVPQILSTSLIIPLVKSYKKSLKDPDNYRGISLIPILPKMLETLVLQKYTSIKSSSNSQYGFKANCSTLHAEFIVVETVKHYNIIGSPVYMFSLDA